MTTLRHLLLASGIALATAGALSAEEYRLSMWVPDSEPTAKANMLFVEDLAKATNGEIAFKYLGGGVLMPPASHLSGIADGVAEAGQITTGYFPSYLRLNNALGAFGFIESDPTAIGAAYADWMMHDAGSISEWNALKIVPVAGFSTGNYELICNTPEPVTELEHFKGLKVRTYGQIGKLVQDLGGVPVSIPGSEAYQALQTGALDCASFGANYLLGQKLIEVTKSTTLVRWNPAFNAPQLSFNKDFWKGLTNEQRATILELGARTHARAQIFYNDDSRQSVEGSIARGYQVVEPGETLKKAVADWVAAGVGDMAGVAKATFGVEDPEAVFASFEPYVKKWGELIRGMKNPMDEEELTQLFLEHMYKDLDPATYGMD